MSNIADNSLLLSYKFDKKENDKNTLWIFGASTSTNFVGGKNEHHKIEDIFGSIIAKEFNLELALIAKPAYCNFASSLAFIDNVNNIKEGDIVIWQITFLDRFSIVPFAGSNILDVMHHLNEMHIHMEPDLVINQLNNFKYEWFKSHVYPYIKNNRNIKFIFWAEEQREHGEFERWDEMCNFVLNPYGNSKSFYFDWMGLFTQYKHKDDYHLSIEGHKAVADHFINLLKN